LRLIFEATVFHSFFLERIKTGTKIIVTNHSSFTIYLFYYSLKSDIMNADNNKNQDNTKNETNDEHQKGSNMVKDPDEWTTGDEKMTGAQRSYLKTLSDQAGEEMDENLTKAEASKKIDELQHKTGRGLDKEDK